MNPPRQWHRHPMRLKREKGDPFKCSGCKELGFGPRYQCAENCDVVLHEVCFKAHPTDRSKTHPFMDNCRFKFLREPPGGPNRRFCHACGRDVRGFVYHDKCKNYDLHPCCMNLEGTMSAPGGMKLILMDKAPYKCVKCERKDLKVPSKEPFRGWSYVFMETKVQSKADSCGNYCYHVYCVKKLILDKWEGGYFNGASSSSRERRLVRGETASSTRSLTTSATSKALARRGSSRPPTSLLTRGFKILKIGFSVLISVLFGNPTPLFPVLLETLLD